MKKNIILLFVIFSCLCVSAQVTHEISIQGGIGYSTLNYKPLKGKHAGGCGGELGFGYTCIFKEQWGFHVGITPAYYSASAKLDGETMVTPNLMDNERDLFDMHTSFIKFKETQHALYLNIPFMAQFQTKTTYPIYVRAGLKVGIPLYGSSKTKNGSFSNAGFYHKTEVLLETQEFAGFGNYENRNAKSKLSFKPTVMLAFEVGTQWNKESKHPIYTGVYFDYGLTNIAKKNNENEKFINYDPVDAPNFTTNSALPFIANKIHNMAVGIKIGIIIHTSRNVATDIE